MNLLLYTNILTPYRKYLYDLISLECKLQGDQFTVLVMSDNENNRVWHYQEFACDYTQLLKGKTISLGETYIHFNCGLFEKIREMNPDIVIASGSYLCPGTWQIAKWKKKLNYTALFWSESHLGEARNYSNLKSQIREKLRSTFYKKFDGFLYPGKLARQFIRSYANNSVEYIFLPNLVDESIYHDEIQRAANPSTIPDEIRLFTPARLSQVKIIGPFLELLAKCKEKEKIYYEIAGDGELRESLENEAKQLGLNVHFLGNQSPQVVSSLYKKCDGFVLPSLSDPNPLSCIEALWSGKPILISNHVGNYPEVVKEGVNGYVFSYENIEEAVEKIDLFVSMNEQWKNEASACSETIAKEIYDSKKTVRRVIKQLKLMKGDINGISVNSHNNL